MFPEHFTSIQFFQKKKNIFLYKASANGQHYVLKCTPSSEEPIRQAFRDEYYVMSRLSHPSVPTYFGLKEAYILPDQAGSFLALCMEDCSRKYALRSEPLSSKPASSETSRSDRAMAELTFTEILLVLDETAQVLIWLLNHGVLYTDLNPSNLILHRHKDTLSVSLVDYTCCYYFLENPHPAYSLRFSYNLSPSLKGQQLLIQELAYFLQDLIGERAGELVPSGIYSLMEAGMNPFGHLSLEDYIRMIREIRI